MENFRKFAFSLGFQTNVLALLLQRPELFDEYPDLWTIDLFDETEHRTIMRAWLHVRYRTGSPPNLASLENELIVKGNIQPGKEDYPLKEKHLTLADQAILQRLRELYSCMTCDAEYIVAEALIWQKQVRMRESINQSVDLLQSGKMEQIPDLILDALSVGQKSPVAGKDFYDTEPDIPDTVFPGVLHVESIGLLLGASKSYKTWNLLNAGIASAMGKSWMGLKDCSPKRTLYCNMELHEEQLKARLDRICPCYGITRSALKGTLDFLNLKGRANGIESVLLHIRSQSRRLGNPFRLIIIDPIYKLYASAETKDGKSSENDLATIGALFEKLERLARELHSAILLAHHFKKGSSAETAMIDLGAGSGGFGRGPDALIALRPLEEEDSWRCESVIRYFPRMEPFGLRLEFPRLVRDETLDLGEVKDRPGPKTKYRVEEILALLPKEGFINKEWLEEAEEKVGCSKKTYRTLRDEALERGLAREEGENGKQSRRHFLTEEGEKLVANCKQAALRDKVKHNGSNRSRRSPSFSKIGGDKSPAL
jgi:AAA domain-containing protein